MEALARWWTRKYKLPSNHELFLERTPFDLYVEYYEDYFDENPLEAHRNSDGSVQFKDTGDALIDQWEERLAKGETPDFLREAFTPEELERLDRLKKRGRARTPGMHPVTMKEAAERFGGLPSREGWSRKDTRVPQQYKHLFGDGTE